MLRLLLISFFLLGSHVFLYAQKIDKGEYKRVSIDVYGGLPFFFGDVHQQFKSFNTSGRFNYVLTSAFSAGGEFSFGQVQGQDDDLKGDYFKTQYLKALVGGEVYLLNLLRFTELGTRFQPYFGFNLGALQSNVKDAGSNEGADAQLHKNWSFANQWHLGAKYKLSNSLDLNLRSCLLLMKSDKFDNQFPAVPNNKSNDVIVNLELGLSIHLGGKQKKSLIWKSNDELEVDSLPEGLEIVEEPVLIDSAMQYLNTQMLQSEDEMLENMALLQAENEKLKEQIVLLGDHLNDLIDYVVAHVESAEKKQNEQKVIVEVKPPSKKPVEKQVEETIKEEAKPSTNTPKESVYSSELVGPISANYYIISGSFTQLSNAEKRIKKLTALGYTPVIMKDPKANNSNRIVIDTADDYKLAKQLLIKYHKELDPEAWIIKHQD